MVIRTQNVKTLFALSPAKLNLFLHVTGRRPDGYHSLQTVFQLLNWGDDMRFEWQESPGITLSGDTDDIAPENNLILRAAKLISPSDQGAHIHVRKRIPRGGGLGGGSSNAATTLLALNRLWELRLSMEALLDFGETIGADVPVFIQGQSAWAEGIGEVLTPVSLPKRWFVVAQPDCMVSTAEIFAHPELTRQTPPITVQAFFSGAGRNDLQPVVESRYPEVQRAVEWLKKHSPDARMTGSGACVFASLESEQEAHDIAAQAPAGLAVIVAEGLERLPDMQEVTE
ncbi:MAG: 4-(cytidine 5'-diphospho)-2-C-methyl-D-erythritol kinase [Halieaceae bacterium]|nr:4-(cytidine 5'-diphospho)-2-C-methyl-D-erythritol kinase [Halieaceae bacterium]